MFVDARSVVKCGHVCRVPSERRIPSNAIGVAGDTVKAGVYRGTSPIRKRSTP